MLIWTRHLKSSSLAWDKTDAYSFVETCFSSHIHFKAQDFCLKCPACKCHLIRLFLRGTFCRKRQILKGNDILRIGSTCLKIATEEWGSNDCRRPYCLNSVSCEGSSGHGLDWVTITQCCMQSVVELTALKSCYQTLCLCVGQMRCLERVAVWEPVLLSL